MHLVLQGTYKYLLKILYSKGFGNTGNLGKRVFQTRNNKHRIYNTFLSDPLYEHTGYSPFKRILNHKY